MSDVVKITEHKKQELENRNKAFECLNTYIKTNFETFMKVGIALWIVNKNNLWESKGYDSFKDYVTLEFGKTEQRAYQILHSVEVNFAFNNTQITTDEVAKSSEHIGKLIDEKCPDEDKIIPDVIALSLYNHVDIDKPDAVKKVIDTIGGTDNDSNNIGELSKLTRKAFINKLAENKKTLKDVLKKRDKKPFNADFARKQVWKIRKDLVSLFDSIEKKPEIFEDKPFVESLRNVENLIKEKLQKSSI